jgi:hypothetical protein
MAFKNPILKFADENWALAAIVVPVGMQLVAKSVFMLIRTGRAGNPIEGLGIGANDDDAASAMHHLGAGQSVLPEGGSPGDLTFRAVATQRPTGHDTHDRDMIQGEPASRHVRYDDKWNESAFFGPLNYKPNGSEKVVTQPHINQYSESLIFNGLSGAHKLK